MIQQPRRMKSTTVLPLYGTIKIAQPYGILYNLSLHEGTLIFYAALTAREVISHLYNVSGPRRQQERCKYENKSEKGLLIPSFLHQFHSFRENTSMKIFLPNYSDGRLRAVKQA